MADETYIVASLEDAKARELGQIMSNANARAILGLLAKKNSTQSEISQELKIPLPTVDYNMKQLMKSGMITIIGTFYSKKGNKINVYTLAKKFILIAPKGVSISGSKIRSILPAALITIGAAGIIKLFYSMRQTMSAPSYAYEGTKIMAAEAATAAPAGAAAINMSTPYALFFVAGALLALGIYLLSNWKKR